MRAAIIAAVVSALVSAITASAATKVIVSKPAQLKNGVVTRAKLARSARPVPSVTVAGAPGAAGATGATGAAGQSVKGDPGSNGLNGTNGTDGATGPIGPAGVFPGVVVASDPVNVPSGGVEAVALCPVGQHPTGGGWQLRDGSPPVIVKTYPQGDGWHIEAFWNGAGVVPVVQAWGTCA